MLELRMDSEKRRPSLNRVNALDRNVVRQVTPRFNVTEDDQFKIYGDDEKVSKLFRALEITRPEGLGIPADAWSDYARSRPGSGELHYNSHHPEKVDASSNVPARAKSLDVTRTSRLAKAEAARRFSLERSQQELSSVVYEAENIQETIGRSTGMPLSPNFSDTTEDQGRSIDSQTDSLTDSQRSFDVPGITDVRTDSQTSAEEAYGSTGSHSSDLSQPEDLRSPSPTLTTKMSWSSWKRLDLLGTGSFGAVYRAVGSDGNFFAVKEVSLLNSDEQSGIQLQQEIALLSLCQHENIVQYLGTQKGANELYIFLELVTQGSLASQYMKYPLFDDQIRRYTKQILEGLVYLHHRKVVHRDIKCANILVHAHGTVKLADFGMAKQLDKINSMRSAKGSVYWMAPEVVHPQKTSGFPADIWSLGCTVLEMATRRPPFSDMEWHTVFWKLGRGQIPPIPETLPPDARDFVAACLQVEPSRRPTAKDLLAHPFVNPPQTPVAVTVTTKVDSCDEGSHHTWSVSTRVDSMRAADSMRTARSVRTRPSIFVEKQ